MIVKEIKNKDIWEDFLDETKEKSFLHSWNWGEFQKALGEKIWRLAIIENSTIQGIALIIKVSAKRGTFFLCPHGPILEDKQLLKGLLEYFISSLLSFISVVIKPCIIYCLYNYCISYYYNNIVRCFKRVKLTILSTKL